MLEPNRELQIDQEWQETVFRNRLHILFHGLSRRWDLPLHTTSRGWKQRNSSMTSHLEHLPKERWSSPFRKASFITSSFTTANRISRGPSFYRRALASANAARGCLCLCNFHLIPKYWYKLSPKTLFGLWVLLVPRAPRGKGISGNQWKERICSCRRCFVVLVWLGKRSESSDFDRS